MSAFPKPRRKGWRFLRKGERLRKGDHYDTGEEDHELNGPAWPACLERYKTAGVSGPRLRLRPAGVWCGYIRRIRGAKQ